MLKNSFARSIVFSALSVILYALAMVLMMLTEAGKSSIIKEVMYPMSWLFTNSGFIAVLFSRLHLILDAPRGLKWTAWLLVGIGIPFHIFLIVASTGTPFHFGMATHNVAFRLETVVSFVEIGFSAVYVYFFSMRFMRDRSGIGGTTWTQLKWTFVVLILGELFVVAGDIAIITVWLNGQYLVRLAIAPLVYGLKLKVEFLILNRLTGMTQKRAELRHITISMANDTNDDAVHAATMAAATVLENAHAVDKVLESDPDVITEEKAHDSGVPHGEPSQRASKKLAVTEFIAQEGTPTPRLKSDSSPARESLDSFERQYLGRTAMNRVEKMV